MNKRVYTFRFQPERCIQCHACTVACKTWNTADPGVELRRFHSRFQGEFPKPKLLPLSISCLHCSEPACASVCPTGAIVQDKDGVVHTEVGLCVGCRACLNACPVAAPQFGADSLMHKCDLCSGEAVCVRACPTAALTLEAVSSEEKSALDANTVRLYREIQNKQ